MLVHMKTSEQRINILIGQLEGAKKILATREHDCFSLIIQLKAVKSGMSSLMERLIAEEFNSCLINQKIKDKEKISKFFKEIIKK